MRGSKPEYPEKTPMVAGGWHPKSCSLGGGWVWDSCRCNPPFGDGDSFNFKCHGRRWVAPKEVQPRTEEGGSGTVVATHLLGMVTVLILSAMVAGGWHPKRCSLELRRVGLGQLSCKPAQTPCRPGQSRRRYGRVARARRHAWLCHIRLASGLEVKGGPGRQACRLLATRLASGK